MPIFRVTIAIAFLIASFRGNQPDIMILGGVLAFACAASFSIDYQAKK